MDSEEEQQLLRAFGTLGWDPAACRCLSRSELASKCRMARAEVHPDRVHDDPEASRTLRRAQETNAALDTVLRACGRRVSRRTSSPTPPHFEAGWRSHGATPRAHDTGPSWGGFGSAGCPPFAHPLDLDEESCEGLFSSLFSSAAAGASSHQPSPSPPVRQ